MEEVLRRAFRALIPLLVFVICVLVQPGCTCAGSQPTPFQGPIACRPQHPSLSTSFSSAPATKTIAAGALPESFSITSTGEASLVIHFITVPGRAGVEPRIALAYDSSGDDGILGVGFSLTGLSAITRCPKSLAQDGEIRDVRYDAADELCLDGKRLVPVGQEDGIVEYRTFPDTSMKVLGHYPKGDTSESALFFEVFTPSGLVIEYGTGAGGKPLARGGVPRAWLATVAHDGRGNAMTYGYCFAEADGYTAEYALDEIRYTRFDGSPAIEPSRAVKLVYETKDPADIRVLYSGGMALQSSLRLGEIQMVGPENRVVRRYDFTYELGPTTKRTLLTQVEECAGDGVCKPPTRFQFQSSAAGFKKRATSVSAPTSLWASPMLLDVNGDGLDDLVLPDTSKALSTPETPITEWLIARNHGQGDAKAYFSSAALALSEEWPLVANPSGPADPTQIQPELGTGIDYNQDGRMDVLVHDVYGSTPNGLVLLTQPDLTFKVHDIGIRRPFPLGPSPSPPTLTRAGGSVHLADVDGDAVPDLIQCQDHGETAAGDPSQAAWAVHLWRPEQGVTPAGFDITGAPLEPLAGFRCDTEFYTLDINGDGKVDLVVQSMLTVDGTERIPASTYSALTRHSDGSWEVFDTKLPIVAPGGRVVFLDVNRDGLPDAVQSGFSDHRLRTYLNTGPTFAEAPVNSLAWSGLGDQDTHFGLSAPIDFNGDGRQDLLMPVPPATLPNQGEALPAWAILQANGAPGGPTFTLVDPHLPFEAALGDAVTLADPRGPRIGDINGDGAQDVILLLGGVYNVFENLAPDQDLLVGVSDGMNPHEPTDPGFSPNVSISYGHLTDAWITNGAAADDPALESYLYLSHSDAANDCAYPRRCAVGPRRVVSAYAQNDGDDGLRHFAVRYRDGRYDRLGRGFLGFGERLITDLDTGAVSADFYDNTTFDEGLEVFPFAGQVQRQWRWQPGLPSQPKPDQIELSFTDITRTVVPTNGNATYFTLATQRRIRREQGVYPPSNDPAKTIEAYVRNVESSGGATMLRDSVAKVTDFDSFGNVRAEEVSTSGVDLTLHVERTFKNDTTRWVLGQLTAQKECSAASKLSQCRSLKRTTTIHGEVETESIADGDGNPDTQLDVVYSRDAFGNVVGIIADDAHGHHRSSSTTYDAEGIFPRSHVNGAGHTTMTEFDPGLGVLTKEIDPNQLVTRREYDGFGRLELEARPDGTQTTITLSRTQDGGPKQDAWRVMQRTTTTGGADETVEYDLLGRPIQWWWHGPATPRGKSEPPRLMQKVAYDARSGQVARRSVPVSEGTLDEEELLFDVYEYDAVGREVRHTTPWGAVTQTSYDAALEQVTDPLLNLTVVKRDPLGRALTVTDAAKGLTQYTYGPFGALYTVVVPGDALTRTTRDAFGRVKQLDDPDRGTTFSTFDGFGELISSTDALSRVVTFGYDAFGRTTSRVDQKGAELLTTTWTWDTAAHGIGKLHKLVSPDAVKTSAYNPLGQLAELTLAITGESEVLHAKLGYDDFGRVDTITYPTPAGAPPFVLAQDYDPYGHVLTVRDSATDVPYWHLDDVDNAGRFQKEVFGNEVITERLYFPDKQRLWRLVSYRGSALPQNLEYAYDVRGNLASRTDNNQPLKPTERFRYDALERLTCAYFSVNENPAAPCKLGYGYAASGNLTSKSDVGILSYGDPAHPHAVTSAGNDSFGYDAVGNQITRPGGVTVSYTPFDLPRTITQSASTVTFGYDGSERRIRKTTPDEETLYFGDLYERVTEVASATTAHRYYVHSPERVVAVVTRGGAELGTRYVHVDHLGSVNALTNEDGAVVERRSYDPFGQRINPEWGKPLPPFFTSKTTKGFTGHESDDELGLVNAKGRIYDPKIGRFLTIDPIVSAPLSGQSWNPYSYVRNNPLSFVDPSGFAEEPAQLLPGPGTELGPDGELEIVVHERREGVNDTGTAAEVGAAAPSVDVSTTGSSSQYVPHVATGVVGVPVSTPGVRGFPLVAPGAPMPVPPNAPGPGSPVPWGPFIEPPPPRAIPPMVAPGAPAAPLGAPGLPIGPAKAPGLTIGGVLGGVLTVFSAGLIFSGDAPDLGVDDEGIPLNRLGQPYPRVPDPRTGKNIPFPGGPLMEVPSEQRTEWNNQTRDKFIAEWHERGYPRAPNNWAGRGTQVHHIKPLLRGGTNDFWNLVPLSPDMHKLFTKYWATY